MKLTAPVILGLIFITLKLCNVITWSWLWVLAPFWFGLALIVLIPLFVLGTAGIMLLFTVLAAAFSSPRWRERP